MLNCQVLTVLNLFNCNDFHLQIPANPIKTFYLCTQEAIYDERKIHTANPTLSAVAVDRQCAKKQVVAMAETAGGA
jgi:hypothetical protein